jgi:hypothetical protein
MKEIILNIEYGGLGDNLFYSPIPYLIKKKSPHTKVYIYNSPNIRSKDISNLIWKNNPYIDGFTQKKGKPINVKLDNNSNKNIISQIADNYLDVEDPNLEPVIYFNLEYLEELSDKTLVDLNYVSFIGAVSRNKIEKYLSKFENLLFINKPKWINDKGDNYSPNNLLSYANAINSCRNFICFTSGGATLAAAIKKKANCIYGFGQNKIFHHSKIHDYIELSPNSTSLKYYLYFILKSKNKLKLLWR